MKSYEVHFIQRIGERTNLRRSAHVTARNPDLAIVRARDLLDSFQPDWQVDGVHDMEML